MNAGEALGTQRVGQTLFFIAQALENILKHEKILQVCMGIVWLGGIEIRRRDMSLVVQIDPGWWFGTRLLFFHTLGISSSQLTNIF